MLPLAQPRPKPSQLEVSHALSSQRENDSESSTLQYRARNYDPRTGRFLQNEPILSRRTTAHYAYASNNPTGFTDPSGKLTYFIGGAADKNPFTVGPVSFGPTRIMLGVMEANLRRGLVPAPEEVNTRYRGYEQVGEIVEEIRKWLRDEHAKKGEPLVLIGHSWGGDAAIDVANRLQKVEVGIKVDVLVTLDAVGWKGRTTTNKKFWINVHRGKSIQDIVAEVPLVGSFLGALASAAGKGVGSNITGGDIIATFGGVYGDESGADVNIKLPALHHEDASQMFKAVTDRYANVIYPDKPLASEAGRYNK